ncbi:MAG: GNAT family N-acetyltransferase [Pseudomonadota bacterium]
MRKSEIEILSYRPEYGLEAVKMWRQSFQRAMALPEQNSRDDLLPQLDYFASLSAATVHVAMDTGNSLIVGLLVVDEQVLEHLYVHVDFQGAGLGRRLLDKAKALSPAGLELYTFQQNQGAQAFYLTQGFVEVARSFADLSSNPWASTQDQLADIKYQWRPSSS